MVKKSTLPLIVFAQFACTSLWFAGNGVMNDLVQSFQLVESALAHLTSAVQFGFISGTLVFAFLSIADRFSPSKVFFMSAIFGALFNFGIIWDGNNLTSLLIFRFLTGFFLAGIYPVGMKIASDYYNKGLGKSLGFLVGALVLGTAFPHLLKGLGSEVPWRIVLIFTSALAVIGGLSILFFVPDGPFRKMSQKPQFTAFLKVFKHQPFRAAAFGYFGHMWELYAFWAFVPFILDNYLSSNQSANFNIPLCSFIIIGAGGLACIAAGYISQNIGLKKTAFFALCLSCACCLFSPLAFNFSSPALFLVFLVFWGMTVIADSPLFSTLVANNAEPEIKGTALTIVNCIGFSITIVSIQLLNTLSTIVNEQNIFILLAIGPIFGLIALLKPVKG